MFVLKVYLVISSHCLVQNFATRCLYGSAKGGGYIQLLFRILKNFHYIQHYSFPKNIDFLLGIEENSAAAFLNCTFLGFQIRTVCMVQWWSLSVMWWKLALLYGSEYVGVQVLVRELHTSDGVQATYFSDPLVVLQPCTLLQNH